MAFYDVILYGSKVAGTATGMGALVEALRVVDKWHAVDQELVRNEPSCAECRDFGKYDGKDALYHHLLIREQVARDIELCGDFKWRKKKGIGRKTPREYLAEICEAGEETWFSVQLLEL